MMETPMDAERLQRLMDASPFICGAQMKVKLIEPEHNRLAIIMPLLPEFERISGSGQFHGGPIAALVDTCGSLVLIMLLGRGVPTINFRTDYLIPAVRTSLRAVATVRRAGRSVGVVDVDVFNDDGKLLAVGRGTFSTLEN